MVVTYVTTGQLSGRQYAKKKDSVTTWLAVRTASTSLIYSTNHITRQFNPRADRATARLTQRLLRAARAPTRFIRQNPRAGGRPARRNFNI